MEETKNQSRAASGWLGPILLAGMATTCLTLFLLWLAPDSVNLMGWYANRIIPVGAILVGLLAGLGYSIVSYRSGTRIGSGLLLAILALQIGAYFLAKYIEFRSVLAAFPEDREQLPSFWKFFDITTQAMAFKPKYGGEASPLGMWGYGIRFLEIGGFCLGTLIVPLILKTTPHCEACQRYKKTRFMCLIPMTAVPRKLNKKDPADLADFEREVETAQKQGEGQVKTILEHLGEGNIAGAVALLASLRPAMNTTNGLVDRLRLDVIHCPSCNEGMVRTQRLLGQGNEIKTVPVGEQPLAGHYVQTLLEGLKSNKI
jgi:hypothetical protein